MKPTTTQPSPVIHGPKNFKFRAVGNWGFDGGQGRETDLGFITSPVPYILDVNGTGDTNVTTT